MIDDDEREKIRGVRECMLTFQKRKNERMCCVKRMGCQMRKKVISREKKTEIMITRVK